MQPLTTTVPVFAVLCFLGGCTSDEKSQSQNQNEGGGGAKANDPDAGPGRTPGSSTAGGAGSSNTGSMGGSATGSDDCPTLFDCVARCDTDACTEDCLNGASEEATTLASDVVACSLLAGCEDDACLQAYCSDELLACANLVATYTGGPTTSNDPDAGAPPVGNGACPVTSGAGTEHSGFIQADEIWAAADSPHVVTSAVQVRGATVTIEPCAVVQVATGATISVGQTSGPAGKLVAKGEKVGDEVRGIVITSQDPRDYWGGMVVVTTGTLELAYVDLERGGHPDGGATYPSALASHADDNRLEVVANISAQHVRITDSATLGVSLEASGGFSADSTDLVVTGCGSQGGKDANIQTANPAYAEAPAIHTLPEGDYTGNEVDSILARAPFTLEVDEAFPARGVPYQLVSEFRMQPPVNEGTTLTIEAGVTLLLGGEDYPTSPLITLGDGADSNGSHEVRLVAEGTDVAPITLTSGASQPAPGDWLGLYWDAAPATGNVMDHVVIEYAGGDNGTSGFGCGPRDNASLVFLAWEPGEAFIQNSTFRHSAAGGIVSAWQSDAASPDLHGSNEFDDIANGCAVSVNPGTDGACPDNGGAPSCY